MKCYYDILAIDKLAPPDIIKKAYYKLSLKWHPDKNPDNVVEATEIFQEIQRAYKVLSNIQERMWYDKNRERFLSMNFNSEDDLYDLINNMVYQGFDNDEYGFYSVHENVFSKLVEREHEACRIRGENLEEIPNFGNSLSHYKEVVGPFYSFWESFSTKMSFHWKNKHEINLSFPRDVRRAMERENAEERTAARKEYNKTIQTLIISIKSRDPRIKLWKEHLNIKAKDNEKKAAHMAQKAWERSRQNTNTKNSFPSYGNISVEELEEKLHSLEIEHGKTGIDYNKDAEDLYCVACNKYFKSLAAFNNHEKSKNHNKNLAALRKQMLLDDEELFADLLNDQSITSVHSDEEKEPIKLKQPASFSDSSETLNLPPINDDDNVITSADVIASKFKLEKKRRRKPKTEKIADNTAVISAGNNDNSLLCERCGNEFLSRNKLFQHVKDTGHGTIKMNNPKSKSNSKVKNK